MPASTQKRRALFSKGDEKIVNDLIDEVNSLVDQTEAKIEEIGNYIPELDKKNIEKMEVSDVVLRLYSSLYDAGKRVAAATVPIVSYVKSLRAATFKQERLRVKFSVRQTPRPQWKDAAIDMARQRWLALEALGRSNLEVEITEDEKDWFKIMTSNTNQFDEAAYIKSVQDASTLSEAVTVAVTPK